MIIKSNPGCESCKPLQKKRFEKLKIIGPLNFRMWFTRESTTGLQIRNIKNINYFDAIIWIRVIPAEGSQRKEEKITLFYEYSDLIVYSIMLNIYAKT